MAAALAGVLLAAPAGAQDSSQLRLEADRVETSEDGRVRASGSPRLLFGAGELSADQIDLIEAERRIEAEGGVILRDAEGNVLRGERLEFDFSDRTGSMEPAEITSANEEQVRLGGERLGADGDVYRLDEAYYTTCPADMESWKLVADHFEYDARKKRIRAEAARLVIGGVPVMYLPWMSASTSRHERKSGFLTPSLEKRSQHYGLRTPYYFNLAENYDATLEPVVIPDGGLFLEGEARYLQRRHSGEARFGYIAKDRLFGDRRRYSLRWVNRGEASPNLSWGIQAERVSDDDFLKDFSGGQDQTSRRNLPVRAFVEGEFGRYRVLLEAEALKHLRDDTERPYNQIPRLVVEFEKELGGFELASRTEIANFRASEAGRVEGLRLREEMSISKVFGSGVRIIPTAGVDLARYELDDFPGDFTPSYAVPYITVDGLMMLHRSGNFFGRKVEQTLEPRVQYGYVAEDSFDGHPVFDTAVADINYATLYDRRRFVGGDRVSNANYLSYGLTSRVWDIVSDREILQFNAVQRVNFDESDVLLPGETGKSARLSNLYFSADLSPRQGLNLIGRLAWNPEQDRMDLIEAESRLELDESRAVNVAFFKVREEDGETDSDLQAEALFPLSGQLDALVRADYSLEENHMSSGEFGFRYRSPCRCWQMSVLAERYVESEGNSESNIYLRFDLIGLAGLGSTRYGNKQDEIRDLW